MQNGWNHRPHASQPTMNSDVPSVVMHTQYTSMVFR